MSAFRLVFRAGTQIATMARDAKWISVAMSADGGVVAASDGVGVSLWEVEAGIF